LDPKDLKRFKNENACEEHVRESKKVDNVLRYIINRRTNRAFAAAGAGTAEEPPRFAKLLTSTPEGEGFLLWQKMALMGEIGDAFDINEKYTELKNFNFQGFVEDRVAAGIDTSYPEAVEHWWCEIEHLTKTHSITFPRELMLATLVEGSPDCVRLELQRRVGTHKPMQATIRTILQKLDARLRGPDLTRDGIKYEKTAQEIEHPGCSGCSRACCQVHRDVLPVRARREETVAARAPSRSRSAVRAEVRRSKRNADDSTGRRTSGASAQDTSSSRPSSQPQTLRQELRHRVKRSDEAGGAATLVDDGLSEPRRRSAKFWDSEWSQREFRTAQSRKDKGRGKWRQ
jgi:hypothetical protein